MTVDRDFDLQMRRSSVEHDEMWRSRCETLPYLEVDAGWRIKVIPPFGGAIVRMLIINSHNATVSVYFDGYSRLGAMPTPYWEAYQIMGDRAECDEDEPVRFPEHGTEELLEFIRTRGCPVRIAVAALGGNPDA